MERRLADTLDGIDVRDGFDDELQDHCMRMPACCRRIPRARGARMTAPTLSSRCGRGSSYA